MTEPTEKSNTTFFGLRKLPARYASIVTPFFLSVIMTCVVSLVATLRTAGWIDGMVRLWLGSWALSWVIAFPVLIFILPTVRRVTAMVVDLRG
ncbi:MAG: DUF2798 domain-containing protein [Rubrivivax sp.]|nr:MAG: DUF2798 domain-containing protein [Rubrivivax sp.]